MAQPLSPEQIEVLDAAWRQLVRFPYARVCRHYAALVVLDAMDALGCAPPADVIGAVVRAEDDVALDWSRGPVCEAEAA